MTQQFGFGFLDPTAMASDHNKLAFFVESFLVEVRTAALVLVQAVHGGGLGPIGTVDVQPLVNIVDGNFNVFPHGTIYGLPYSRVQGGNNAIICDPAVNDVGLAVICDRDISSVKNNNGAQSNPGSWRKHDLADGIYLFPVIAKTPTQYLWFKNNGLQVTDINGNQITFNSSGVAIADDNSNVITMLSAGITLQDDHSNKIQMESGDITLTSTLVKTSGVFHAGNGASGTFTTTDGKTVTVVSGIITAIV